MHKEPSTTMEQVLRMKNDDQVVVCSALLDYYHSACTNHVIYILTVILALFTFLTMQGRPILVTSILVSFGSCAVVHFSIRFLWWGYLANEVVHSRNVNLGDFASLHEQLAKAVEIRGQDEKIPRVVYRLLKTWSQLILTIIIWFLTFFIGLSYYVVMGAVPSELSWVSPFLVIVGTILSLLGLTLFIWTALEENTR